MGDLTNANTALIKQVRQKQLEMAAEWSDMKNEWGNMKEQLHKSEHKIDRILTLLENDETIGSKGIVQQVRENSAIISDWKSKAIALVGVGSILVSIAFDIIIELLRNES